MTRRLRVALLLICTAASSSCSAQPVPADRAQTPSPVLAARHVEELDNGLTLVHIAESKLPLTTFALFLGAGVAYDSVGRRGLGHFALNLAFTGHGDLTEEQLLNRIGDLGGEYGIDVQVQYSAVWFSCLSSRARDGLDLFEGALRSPRLEGTTIEREKNKLASLIGWRRNEPYYLAFDAFIQAVIGDHAYGRAMCTAQQSELEDVGEDELRARLQSILRPDGGVLFVMGPCEEGLLDVARARFGAWQAGQEPRPPVAVRGAKPEKLTFRTVVRPGIAQVYLRLGAMGPAVGSPERAAHQVFARAMAAGFTSVLVDELRVNRGLIYGVALQQDWLAQPSPFSLVMSTQADKAGEVIGVTFDKLREVRSGKLDGLVVEAARNTLLRSLAQAVVRPQQRARAEYLGWRYQQDFDAWRRHFVTVRAVTKQDVIAVARAYDPATFTVVMVGTRDNLAAIPTGELR